MKKSILSLLCGLFAVTAQAQLRSIPNVADTAINADAVNLSFQSPGYADVTTVQLNIIKISGTVAGSAYVQGSLDNVNWFTVSDTLTLADATQVKIWALGTAQHLYYRVRVVTSGTQRSLPSAIVLFRKS